MNALWVGGTKVPSNSDGHMTKMAAMPIYGKNGNLTFQGHMNMSIYGKKNSKMKKKFYNLATRSLSDCSLIRFQQ